MKSITLKAFAKLNLFLDITGRRDDGYHEILTAMHLISLADDVTVNVSGGEGITVNCDNPSIPADSRNTAYKAAELFLDKLNREAKIDISIEKHIPQMAGLGGSSADAAAVLRALNQLAGKPFTQAGLLAAGADIGADVPFCIHGGYAFCTGTGATIAKAIPELGGAFVIIVPDFKCSTAEAYALYDRNPISRYESENPFLYNAFEKLYNDSRIEEVKNSLITAGALGACLTGSGSAVFGVFDEAEKAAVAFECLDYPNKYIASGVKKLDN